ncbi:hypothetical protein Hanom_Chr12g01181631 [Helianthus anomalus]
MALTWATGVRLGRATRQFERENKLYLAANAYGGLGHRPGRKNMGSVYGVPKELKHYGCMADLLARAGLINEDKEVEGFKEGEEVFWM